MDDKVLRKMVVELLRGGSALVSPEAALKQVNPRLAMVTHMAFDEPLIAETLAAIRQQWHGLFAFGAVAFCGRALRA